MLSLSLSLGLTASSNSGPAIALSGGSVLESATIGTAVGTLSVVGHPSGSSGWAFVKTLDPDSKFSLTGAALSTAATFDYETKTSHQVTITASKAGQTDLVRVISVSVTNVAELPAAPTMSLSASDGQVSIAWTDNSFTGPAITAHRIYRGTTSGSLTLLGTVTGASPFADTGLTNGTTYYYRVSAVNSDGESTLAAEQSAVPGTVTITAPVATLTSAAGDAPQVDLAFDGTVYAGYYLRVERSTTGTKDGTGAYTSPTLSVLYQITSSDLSDGITDIELATEGYAPPTGTWYHHYRIEREDGAMSVWSNELTGTVVTSIAQLVTSTGVNKSQYVNVTGTPILTATSNNNVGGQCDVKADVSASGKRHFEVTILSISPAAQAGPAMVGVVDASTAIGPAVFGAIGSATLGGAAVEIKRNGTTSVTVNNTTVSTASVGTPQVGDIIVCEFDTTASAISFWHKRGATETSLGSYTMTSGIPTTYHAVVGVYTNLSGADAVQCNFGASAFAKTPSTGYLMYG